MENNFRTSLKLNENMDELEWIIRDDFHIPETPYSYMRALCIVPDEDNQFKMSQAGNYSGKSNGYICKKHGKRAENNKNRSVEDVFFGHLFGWGVHYLKSFEELKQAEECEENLIKKTIDSGLLSFNYSPSARYESNNAINNGIRKEYDSYYKLHIEKIKNQPEYLICMILINQYLKLDFFNNFNDIRFLIIKKYFINNFNNLLNIFNKKILSSKKIPYEKEHRLGCLYNAIFKLYHYEKLIKIVENHNDVDTRNCAKILKNGLKEIDFKRNTYWNEAYDRYDLRYKDEKLVEIAIKSAINTDKGNRNLKSRLNELNVLESEKRGMALGERKQRERDEILKRLSNQ